MHAFVKKAGFSLLLSLGAISVAYALPADFMDKLEADSRPAEDKARDGARRPYQVMELLGVQEGWTVVDVAAGGGWFTRVISAAVGPNGKVLSQVGARALQNNNGQAARDMAAALGNVEPIFTDVAEIPAGSADAAVTALNFHDAYNGRGEEGGQAFLKGLYDVLKPGGVALFIDHEGDDGADNRALHRIPTEVARAQIIKAGFQIVAESDILNTTADDHTLSSSDPILGRDTDQFLFIVRKP
ncbi:MAG: class I SAM-dependent methyltransferase [Pseudomonadales bacterium]|jgi:predicted methyltransferase|nr:class I SAM-dependent methyltransferase [Pseudomonadales bacterium]